MEVLLLEDIPGIGKKNDLLVVGDGYALNYLLPRRVALVATPLVRKRYAEFIKRRAEEREREKSAVAGVVQALSGKILTFARKATKTGKLYAAITEKDISEALRKQQNAEVSEDAVKIDDQIKAVGSHQIMLQIGEQTFSVTVNVTEEMSK